MENKYNENGGIGAVKNNGTRAFVQTYMHDEVTITLIDNQNNESEQFIRIRIGTNEGGQIIMLENGKFYMIKGFTQKVLWSDEISSTTVFRAVKDIIELSNTIGSLTDLQTNTHDNIVHAINEVAIRASTPRRLVGYVKYATDGVDPEVEDLSIRYNDKTKRFEYFSDVNGWTLLPVGWQRLQHIVRSRDYLPTEPKEYEVYGILNEDKVVSWQNGEWIEVFTVLDQIGDEYLVQEVHNKLFNGDATGSVIFTEMGWTYLVHYNYL